MRAAQIAAGAAARARLATEGDRARIVGPGRRHGEARAGLRRAGTLRGALAMEGAELGAQVVTRGRIDHGSSSGEWL
ncbi:hypothetical protein CMN24_00420 [Candidatus Saccharibacteria bacterium]|nr:hypothetical protein [Candidatus Saccharibacteria bacterium]